MNQPIFSNYGRKKHFINYLDLDYKVCIKCNTLKKCNLFNISKNNYATYCKECYKMYKIKGNYYQKKKIQAFNKIKKNKIECVRCGCNDIRLLEVNHKNGGGSQEKKNSKYSNAVLSVIYGNRKTDDLELLCRPCNHIHYLELKYGKLPMEVKWYGS